MSKLAIPTRRDIPVRATHPACSSLVLICDSSPCLLSCILGALNTAISLSVHPAVASNWSTSSVAALVLAIVSSLVYTLLSLLIYRKISRVRRSNPSHSNLYLSKSKHLSNSETLTLLPGDEEATRQGLLRLLAQKESPRLSPSQTTYRIDIPDDARAARNPPPPIIPLTSFNPYNISDPLSCGGGPDAASLSHLAAPTATYESVQARGRSTYIAGGARDQQQLAPSSHRRHYHEDSADARRAVLLAARQRERTRSRESAENNNNLYREHSPASPPVIVNTQHPYNADLAGIPLEERHPLERGEADRDFVAGRGSKDKEEFERLRTEDEGVWRPEDHVGEEEQELGDEEETRGLSWQSPREDDAGPVFEIVEGTVEVDLRKLKRMQANKGRGLNQARQERENARAQETARREIISPLSAENLSPGQGVGFGGAVGEGSMNGNTGQSWNKTPSEYVRGHAEELDGEWTERRELDGSPF